MWSSPEPAIKPINFRLFIGKLKEEFSRREQQDAQEFLTFLLDGLHEEVNKIIKKPFFEYPDVKNRDIPDLALECLSMNLARNWSFFGFLFTGQLGSELVCTLCKHVSWSFEPFMTLSLPISYNSLVPINVHVIHLPEAIRQKFNSKPIICQSPEFADMPMQASVIISRTDTIEKLGKLLQENERLNLTNSENIKLQFCSISLGKIEQLISDKGKIESIEHISQRQELWAIEVLTEQYRKSIKTPSENQSSIKTGASNSQTLSKDPSENVEDEEDEKEEKIKTNPVKKEDPKPSYNSLTTYKPKEFILHFSHRYIRKRTSTLGKRYEIKQLNDVPLLVNISQETSNFEVYMQIWESMLACLRHNSSYRKKENLWWYSEKVMKVPQRAKKPFILRKVNLYGQICGQCPWNEQCLGKSAV